jgi:hypothetical protein
MQRYATTDYNGIPPVDEFAKKQHHPRRRRAECVLMSNLRVGGHPIRMIRLFRVQAVRHAQEGHTVSRITARPLPPLLLCNQRRDTRVSKSLAAKKASEVFR